MIARLGPPVRLLTSLAMTAFVAGCGLADALKPAITPARQLEGTWKSAVPITLTYQSDFCSGHTENVSQSRWDVTWIVTAQAGFENVLDIEMRFTRTQATPLPSSCGNGATLWVPLPSPTFLEATLSSSAITAYSAPDGINAWGSFTTDLMMLTWVRHDCVITCGGEVSADQEFKLVRKR